MFNILFPYSITLPTQEKAVKVKVAFQVRIRPGSFQTGKQTIRVGAQANHPIDSHIDNNEIEWMTEERAAIVPVALLIKIEGGSPT